MVRVWATESKGEAQTVPINTAPMKRAGMRGDSFRSGRFEPVPLFSSEVLKVKGWACRVVYDYGGASESSPRSIGASGSGLSGTVTAIEHAAADLRLHGPAP